MSHSADDDRSPRINRRELLTAAALPVAAALAPGALSAQEHRRSTAAARDKIRVGIVGAGGIVGSVHIPGLRKMPNVEIVAVANRSLESSERAAKEFGIPHAYADWQQLLAAKGLDAVLIGTWPYMHRAVTLAALDSGRHVLCQARMANDAAEARDMLAASQRHSNLVCQLVPSSGTYKGIVVFQARNDSNPVKIAGNAGSSTPISFGGIIYVPNSTQVTLATGTATLTAKAIVAQNIKVSSPVTIG